MTEILTESFCERCGTRYTFESARPKLRLKGMKTVSRGLKNFVLSDGSSMDEAMAAARSETEREVTAYQLDAFHKTFNFCMQCRQYTCPNCWNEVEARCLTCAPHLGHEIMPAPFPDLPATPHVMADETTGGGAILVNGSNGAWGGESSDADVDFDVAARLDALTMSAAAAPAPAPVAETMVETETIDASQAEAAPDVTAEAPVAPSSDAPTAGHHAAELAALAAAAAVVKDRAADETPKPAREESDSKSGGRFSPFRLGQDIDAELAAYERDQAALAAAAVVATSDDFPVDGAELEAPAAEREAMAEAVAEPELVTEAVAEPSVLAETVAVEPEAIAESEAAADPKAHVEPMDALAALAAAEVVAEPEAVAEPESTAEVVVEAEAEPAAATVAEAEPEPVARAEAVPEPAPAAESPAEPTPVAEDVVAQPTWRMVAPDTADATVPPAAPELPAAAIAANPSDEPQWPTRPDWLGGTPAAGLPFLGRPATPQGGLEALWAESSREVADPRLANKPAGGVQPCLSCGLSLSATARFCRRCGTPQAT